MKSENISAKTAKKRLKDMKKHVSKVLYLILNACSWITLSNHKLIEVAVITIRKISCPDFKVLFNCICQWTQDFYQVAYRNNWEPQRQRLFTARRQGVYSCVPNKRAGHNKRAGWKMSQNQINVLGQISVQGGKMLNLDNLVG